MGAFLERLTALFQQSEPTHSNDSTEDESQLEQVVEALFAHSSERSFKETLGFICSLAACTHGSIWAYQDTRQFGNGEYLSLQAATAESEDLYVQPILSRDSGLAWKAIDATHQIQIVDFEDTTDVTNIEVGQHFYKGRSVALIRLAINSDVMGVVCLSVARENQPDVKVLSNIAKIASLSLRNHFLERKVELLEKIPKVVNFEAETIEAVVGVAENNVIESLSVQVCKICLFDGENQAQPITSTYLSENEWRLFDELIQTAKKEGVVQTKSARLESKELIEVVKPLPDGLVPVIAVPLIDHDSNVFGILTTIGKTRPVNAKAIAEPIQTEDVEFLVQVAQRIAPMLEALEHFSEVDRINKHLIAAEKVREHELKAPLSSILQNTHFLDRNFSKLPPRRIEERLRDINEDVELCSFSLRDTNLLLNDVKFEQFQYISPRKLVENVERFLKRETRKRSNLKFRGSRNEAEEMIELEPDLTIEVRGSTPRTMLHRNLMMRALYNVGINALKYGKAGGSLTIRLSEREDMICISFIDDGLGIKDEPKELLRNGKRGSNVGKRPGQGIGLFVTKRVIEIHDGILDFKSKSDPTQIDIYLPVVKNPKSTFSTDLPEHIKRKDKPKRRYR